MADKYICPHRGTTYDHRVPFERESMAFTKIMRAAAKLITKLDFNIKLTYPLERTLERFPARLHVPPEDVSISDYLFANGSYQIPVRLFSPQTPTDELLLFFHGGGWVTGSLLNYSSLCTDLVQTTGCRLAFVDYRLAPEHRFPAALQDCYAVTRGVFMENFLDTDPEKVTTIGDSAGGNLAAALSLMARDKGDFMPKAQILLYPAVYFDYSSHSPYPSVMENGKDYILTAKRIRGCMDLYRSAPVDNSNPYFAPLVAEDLSGQPRTLMITAQYDPLRDEGEHYAKRLSQAGNDVNCVRIPDAMHAFMMLPPRFETVRRTNIEISNFLGKGA